MSRRSLLLIAAVALLLAVILAVTLAVGSRNAGNQTANAPAAPGSVTAIGVRTKTTGCVVNGGLPDHACTPGSIVPGATKEKVCVPGYARSVRNVPVELKRQVYESYGIRAHQAGQYEVDHLISLELGGANEISNLWPQAAEPRPGFHEKDRYENDVHARVCRGEMTLEEAQRRIAENWLRYWNDAGGP